MPYLHSTACSRVNTTVCRIFSCRAGSHSLPRQIRVSGEGHRLFEKMRGCTTALHVCWGTRRAHLRRQMPSRSSVAGCPLPAAYKFPGGHRGGVTPVPIPNTEVKPSTADGTAGAGLWESRSLPGIYRSPEHLHDAQGFFFCGPGWNPPSPHGFGAPGSRPYQHNPPFDRHTIDEIRS